MTLPANLTDAPFTEAEARKATDKVAGSLSGLRVAVANLYLRGADKALGYASWDEYAKAEFAELGLMLPREARKAEVQSLAEWGFPTRAIAAAVGASRDTVERDLGRRVDLERRGRAIEDQVEPDDEIVEAELVEEERPVTPPWEVEDDTPPRAPRTDVLMTMESVIREAQRAAESARQIKPAHLRSRPEHVSGDWHRRLVEPVAELQALITQLKEASE